MKEGDRCEDISYESDKFSGKESQFAQIEALMKINARLDSIVTDNTELGPRLRVVVGEILDNGCMQPAHVLGELMTQRPAEAFVFFNSKLIELRRLAAEDRKKEDHNFGRRNGSDRVTSSVLSKGGHVHNPVSGLHMRVRAIMEGLIDLPEMTKNNRSEG